MKNYSVFDIKYDLDGLNQDELDPDDFPNELIVVLDDDADPSLELADEISNQTGWCVDTFQFEEVTTLASLLEAKEG